MTHVVYDVEVEYSAISVRQLAYEAVECFGRNVFRDYAVFTGPVFAARFYIHEFETAVAADKFNVSSTKYKSLKIW